MHDHRSRMIAFFGVLGAIFLAALDQTIVGTAMPRIIAELHGFDRYTWVTTAYMLTSTALVPMVGKLSDQLGRKRVFMVGIVGFLAGSALTGAAWNFDVLIGFRALQGVGAGILTGSAFAIIADLFDARERGKYTGLVTGMFGLASVVGPLVGGFLTDNWGWRWVFYVNLPIGALVLVGLALTFPRFPRRGGAKIDYLGSLGLALGAGGLVLGASLAGTEGWSSAWTLLSLGLGAVILVATLFHEARTPEAVLPPSIYRSRIYAMVAVLTFLLSVSMFGAITFIPLFLQGVVRVSATSSGLLLTPMMFGLVGGSIFSGLMVSRTGRYRVLAISCFALVLASAVLLTRLGINSSQSEVVTYMVILGLGMGLGMAVFNVVAQNAVSSKMVGPATSALQFTRQMGGAFGLAAMGAVVSQHLSQEIAHDVPSSAIRLLPPALAARILDPRSLLSGQGGTFDPTRFDPQVAAAVAQVMSGMRLAISNSVHYGFVLAAVVTAASLVLVLFLPEVPLTQRARRSEPATEQAVMAAGPTGEPSRS